MSHFTVAVITKGKPTEEQIHKALAPYQENNMGDCPKEYLKWHSVTAEEKERYRNGTVKMLKMEDGRLLNIWEAGFWEEEINDNGCKCRRYKVPDNLEKVEVPYIQLYPTFEQFMKKRSSNSFDEEMQDYGYWENPNEKWEWYQIGGRFAGKIKVKYENQDIQYDSISTFLAQNPYNNENVSIKNVDCARIKDIIIFSQKDYIEAIRFWELYIEKQEPKNEKEKDMIKECFYKKEYYLNKYKTKEKYAYCQSQFSTWAVITKDGKWHEPGTMGVCATSSATLEEELAFEENYKKLVFDNAEEDDYLTVVDCHI